MNKREQAHHSVSELSYYYASEFIRHIHEWIGTNNEAEDPIYGNSVPVSRRRELLSDVFGITDWYKKLSDLPVDMEERIDLLTSSRYRIDNAWDGSDFGARYEYTPGEMSTLEDLSFYISQVLFAYEVTVQNCEALELDPSEQYKILAQF